MSLASSELLQLKWNSYEVNFHLAFSEIRENNKFHDVTIATPDGNALAHRVLLSAFSPVLARILDMNPHPQPLLYIHGISHKSLSSILDFMYKGEAHISQDTMEEFLAAAEMLRVKGLSDSGLDKDSVNVSQNVMNDSVNVSQNVMNDSVNVSQNVINDSVNTSQDGSTQSADSIPITEETSNVESPRSSSTVLIPPKYSHNKAANFKKAMNNEQRLSEPMQNDKNEWMLKVLQNIGELNINVENSEYFRNHPNQLSGYSSQSVRDQFMSDESLPTGWKIRKTQRESNHNRRYDTEFLSPDGRKARSRPAVVEYMKLMGIYDEEDFLKIMPTPIVDKVETPKQNGSYEEIVIDDDDDDMIDNEKDDENTSSAKNKDLKRKSESEVKIESVIDSVVRKGLANSTPKIRKVSLGLMQVDSDGAQVDSDGAPILNQDPTNGNDIRDLQIQDDNMSFLSDITYQDDVLGDGIDCEGKVIFTKSAEDKAKFKALVEGMINENHSINGFDCLMCGKQFAGCKSNKKNALSHVDHIHTDDCLHKCIICNVLVKTSDALTRHIGKFHKNKEVQDYIPVD